MTTIDHIDKYLVLLSIERQKLISRQAQIQAIESNLLSCRRAELLMANQPEIASDIDQIRKSLFSLGILE